MNGSNDKIVARLAISTVIIALFLICAIIIMAICPKSERSLRESNKRLGNDHVAVWVVVKGERYHKNPECSNMAEPVMVSVEEAIQKSYTPCEKCYN